MGRAGNFEESADDRICRSKLIDAHDRDCQAIVVVVAKDSGTDHLFGAGACPIVSLFGPTDPRRWAPFAALQKNGLDAGIRWRRDSVCSADPR